MTIEDLQRLIIESKIASFIVINRIDELRDTQYHRAKIKQTAQPFYHNLMNLYKKETKECFDIDDNGALINSMNMIEDISKNLSKLSLEEMSEVDEFIKTKIK